MTVDAECLDLCFPVFWLCVGVFSDASTGEYLSLAAVCTWSYNCLSWVCRLFTTAHFCSLRAASLGLALRILYVSVDIFLSSFRCPLLACDFVCVFILSLGTHPRRGGYVYGCGR